MAEAEEKQKFQDFCQKLGMFIYQYWIAITGQMMLWKTGIANFKANGSASSLNLEIYWSVKRWTSNEQVITQVLGGHTQIQPPTSWRYQQNQIPITEIVNRYNKYKADNQVDIYLRSVAHWLKTNLAKLHDEEEQK